ncbi:MAG: cob(I)yrinic acid a,c-diamide adenosyltransferase [Deltaproteobacteria bacterium]|jgi:cob(I)alamin adenosyltransferase|nr:cob(I)yrinic acid a,c-diamide adenosyltransferase [Deltaproteobacteria bacterium]
MVTLSKIYTRTGDGGTTRLVGGQEVPKDALRIEAYGTIDELNSIIGLCRMELLAPSDGTQLPPTDIARLDAWFLDLQQALFDLGSDLATRLEDRWPGQPLIRPENIAALEAFIDVENAHLGVLKSFVLPGGTRLNALLHLARTVCRRAERVAITLGREEPIGPEVVPWVNRLSDTLFVLSRRVSQLAGVPEVLWRK